MQDIQLWTASALTEVMSEEFSAICFMTAGPPRNDRLRDFEKELSDAGIRALLQTPSHTALLNADDATRLRTEANRVTPGPASIYFIHYNYDFCEDAEIAYTAREACRLVADALFQGCDVGLSDTDIDQCTDVFSEAVVHAFAEGDWRGLTIHRLDPSAQQLDCFMN